MRPGASGAVGSPDGTCENTLGMSAGAGDVAGGGDGVGGEEVPVHDMVR
jgi:hypothetical protein